MSAMPVSLPDAPDARDPQGAFPRFTLRDLVAEGERAFRMRTLAQAAVLGLALALVALALPTERLVGRGSALVTALSGEAPWYEIAAFGATAPLAALLEPLVGSLERAAFLVGALTWALALPWLTNLAMRAGAEPLTALAIGTAGAISPIGWCAATLPGPEAAGLLGATLVVHAMFSNRLGKRFVATIVLALVLDPFNALLFPAIALRLACERSFLGLGRYAFFAAVAVAAASGALLVAWTTDSELVAPSRWIGACVLALTLAPCAFLLRRPKAKEESRPPAWLALVPVGAIVGVAIPAFGPAAAPALVPLVVTALGYLAGQIDESPRVRVGLAALALSAVATAASEAALAQSDPDRRWRARAQALLEPEDLYATSNARRRYVLAERYGLDVLDLSSVLADDVADAARAARQRGGRLVHDGDPKLFGPRLWQALVDGGVEFAALER